MTPESTSNERGTLAYACVLALAAILVWSFVSVPLLRTPSVRGPAPTVIAVLAFVLAGRFAVLYRRANGEVEELTVSNLVLALTLPTVGPAVAVSGRIIGECVNSLLRRRPMVKTVVNTAAASVESVVAATFFLAVIRLAGPELDWMAVVGAAVLGDAVSFVVVAVAIAIYRRTRAGLFDSPASFGLFAAVADASMGAMVLVIYRAEPWAVVLVVAVPVMLVAGYRNHSKLEEQHRRLGLLHEVTSSLAAVQDDAELAGALVTTIVTTMRADAGWLVLEATSGPALVRPVGQSAASDAFALRAAAVADKNGAARFTLDDDDLADRSVLVGEIVAGDLRAQLVLSGPVGAPPWEDGDVATFATLVSQASVALRVGDLADRLEREIDAMARSERTDFLTGLPNRAGFLEFAQAGLSTARTLAVGVLDLRGFQNVNETLGHASGDLVLCEIARRLAAFREGDLVMSRIGGDDFAFMVDANEADSVAAHLLWRLSDEPVVVDGLALTITGAIGIARSGRDADDVDGLLRCAHVALRQAKALPSGRCEYVSTADRLTTRRLQLATELASAIDDDALTVAWQPQVDLRTRRIVGAEALVRWIHPVLGSVPPEEFVQVAEESGLVFRLSHAVMRRALTELSAIHSAGHLLRGSINLSAHNLLEDDFASTISTLLDSTGADPRQVRFEITETVAMIDPIRTKYRVGELVSLGASISIDDFGTGYSSLAYLHDLHASEVKIDRSFTAEVTSSEKARTITRAIARLGSELGLETVAEGIEDLPTAEIMATIGCTLGQGFHFDRPMGAKTLRARLDSQRLHR